LPQRSDCDPWSGHPAAADDTINCTYPFWPGFAPCIWRPARLFPGRGLTVNEAFDDDRGNVLPALERGDIQCDMRTVGEHQGRPRTPETQGTIIGTIDVSLGGDGVVADGTIKNAGDLRARSSPSNRTSRPACWRRWS